MQAFCNTHSDYQMEKTDETILALWKLMKYSSIKAAIYIYIFQEAQQGLEINENSNNLVVIPW